MLFGRGFFFFRWLGKMVNGEENRGQRSGN